MMLHAIAAAALLLRYAATTLTLLLIMPLPPLLLPLVSLRHAPLMPRFSMMAVMLLITFFDAAPATPLPP